MLHELDQAINRASVKDTERKKLASKLREQAELILARDGLRRPNTTFWLGLPILPIDLLY